MKKTKSKQKQINWKMWALVGLIVGGGVYFGVRKTLMQRPEIDVVKGPQPVERKNDGRVNVWLEADCPVRIQTKNQGEMGGCSQFKVSMVPGEEGRLMVMAEVPSGDMVTGIEGEISYNPKLVKITEIRPSKYLSVKLRDWSKNIKVEGNKATVKFAYGLGLKEAKSGLIGNKEGIDEAGKTVPLMTVTYRVTGFGVSQITMPKEALKIATRMGAGNQLNATKSRLSIVVTGSRLVMPPEKRPTEGVGPEPKPTIMPVPKISRYDLNNDGRVNILDYNLFLRAFGKTGQQKADFNGDKVVDVVDYNLLLKAMNVGIGGEGPIYW